MNVRVLKILLVSSQWPYPCQVGGHEVRGSLHVVWVLVRLHHVLGREPLVVRVADGPRSDQQVPHQQLWVAAPAFALNDGEEV